MIKEFSVLTGARQYHTYNYFSLFLYSDGVVC